MRKTLRCLYNAIERSFDRQALRQNVHFVRKLEHTKTPITARHAFTVVLPAAQALDHRPRLKLITAPDSIRPDGTAVRWEFFFELPSRRAKLECDWYIQWDHNADEYGVAQLVVKAQPFPPTDNLIRRMVDEGQLLHQQLLRLWYEERRRRPDLPDEFRDTNEVMEEIRRQGVEVSDIELSLSTGQSATGHPSWVVRTRTDTYYVGLR